MTIRGVPKARRFLRGGLTAFVGWILVFVGIAGGAVAVSEFAWFNQWVTSTQLSLPEYALPEDWVLLLFSAVSAGVGVMLIGFAADERRREEQLRVDPLDYPPFRRPSWQKVIPVAVALAVFVALPGFYTIPQGQSVQEASSVGPCPVTVSSFTLHIPSGAIFTYEWRSSDGATISDVYAPNGPTIAAGTSSSGMFYNSSFGYASVQSNGTPIQIWACDNGPGPAGLQIDLTGNYYLFR